MNKPELNIVAIDGAWLSQAQRSRLSTYGHLMLYENPPTSKLELVDRISEAEVVLVGDTIIDEEALSHAANLQIISLGSSGFDHVDIVTARERGVVVCNAPGCSAIPIAEHTIAAAITYLHEFRAADQSVREGEYSGVNFVTPELRGRTFGIIGLGHVGREVARAANYFGCEVVCFTREPSNERAVLADISFVDLDFLLHECEIISINCALNGETHELIGREEFRKMKRKPFLINTARGKIINQEALLDALLKDQIRGAALDVLWDEPPDPSDPLLDMENVFFTPHSAGSSEEAFERLSELCVDNIEAFLSGSPRNIVWS